MCAMTALDVNPFHFSGPLAPENMIDRDREADELLALALGGHSFRLVGPRRYGKTTLLRRVLDAAEREGHAAVLVDLQDVLSVAEIVVRIERAYDRIKGPVRKRVEALLRAWNIGLSLGGGGFTATLARNPSVDPEAVLLRLLDLPRELFDRDGTSSVIVFDEIQDVLAVAGADGKLRSVIQHHGEAATYAFAGSAPGMMAQLFGNPQRPLLDQAVPLELEPLPLAASADYIEDRFARSGRDPGTALAPMLEFVRGHPQRTMLLAHYLWARTAPGTTADERTWFAALDRASADGVPLMNAIWRTLTVNERRVLMALTVISTSLYSQATASAVGINRSSIAGTVETLLAKADLIRVGDQLRVTDPLFEHWLVRRGLNGIDESAERDAEQG